MTHYHLQIFYAIAQHIDLYFLMQNPAPNDYWYEDKSEKVIDFLKEKILYLKQKNPFQILCLPIGEVDSRYFHDDV